MKILIIIIMAIIVVLGGSSWWSRSMQSRNSQIISKTGIHWHPELEIYVEGEKIEIPQNMGIVGEHGPVHTHEDLPIIHLEFPGLVRESDIRLGKFFEVWKKDFREFGPNVTMTVNGGENTEFGNYIMRHEDKIVLRYSK